MALIKLDPIVDKISGKVGGQSFVAGTNGNYIRNNAQTRKGTLNQGYQSKTKTPGVNATWQKLTNAEKQTFIDLVGTYPYINRIDEVQQYSAYQIFMLCAQGTQLINESIKFTASAFVVINKPLIEVFVNNSTSMTIEILNPQSGIYYAIYATSPQGVGIYSVRRNIRYLGYVTEAEAANIFDISAIYDAKFNAILPDRNYGIMVKPVVLNSGQIGPKSDISISPFLDIPTPPPSTNTFIYGIASIAPDEASLSALIGASVASMSNFAIISDDVFVTISSSYSFPENAFLNNTLITGFEDNAGHATLSFGSFSGASNLEFFRSPPIINMSNNVFLGCTSLIELPDLSLLSFIGQFILRDTTAFTTPIINNVATIVSTSAFQNSRISAFTSNSVDSIANNAFASNINLTSINIINATILGTTAFNQTRSTIYDFPNVLVVGNFCFANCANAVTINLNSCTDLGTSVGDNGVFINLKLNCTITVPIALATNNGGNPDGDLQYAVASRNATIIYV